VFLKKTNVRINSTYTILDIYKCPESRIAVLAAK